MSKRIIVLGIMRSGTSLTAELIRRWGAYAGAEKNLWKTDIDDPRGYGYMEYKPLQDLNDELLDHNARLPVSNEVLEKKAAEPAFSKMARNLLTDMDEQAAKNQFNSWVWKDARLPLTLPFWMKFWDEPIYVITVRHPLDVVLSASKTEGIEPDDLPYSAGFAYWQYCMLNILSFTEHTRCKIFISYDQLIQNPQGECARLGRFLDRCCERPAEGSQGRIEAMLPQITGSQRHYHSEKSLAEVEQATKEQRALYNFLRVKTMYPHETFNESDFALYPGWKEYLQSVNMLLTLSESLGKTLKRSS